MSEGSLPPTGGGPNSTTINVEALEHYRDKENLNYTQLARRADITTQTLYRARNGEAIEVENVHALAKALSISYELLVYGIQPPIPLTLREESAENRFSVKLYASIPLDEAHRRRHAIQILLRKIVSGSDNIEIAHVSSGSTILTVQMGDADILRLLAAMIDNTLASLDITKIDIPDPLWARRMMKMLISLHIFNTAKEPDTSAWIAMLNYGEMDKLRLRSTFCYFCKEIDEP